MRRRVTNEGKAASLSYTVPPESIYPFTEVLPWTINQGSTLTFQLTSLVASDNLDVTNQKKFLLAKRWCLVWYDMV